MDPVVAGVQSDNASDKYVHDELKAETMHFARECCNQHQHAPAEEKEEQDEGEEEPPTFGFAISSSMTMPPRRGSNGSGSLAFETPKWLRERLSRRRPSPVRLASLQDIEAKLRSAERKRRERLEVVVRKAVRSGGSGPSSPSGEREKRSTKQRQQGRKILEWKLKTAAEKRNMSVEAVRSRARYFLNRRRENILVFEAESRRRSKELGERICGKDAAAATKRQQRQRSFRVRAKSIDSNIKSIAEKRKSARRRLFADQQQRLDIAEQARVSMLEAASRRARDHVAHVKEVAMRRKRAAETIQRSWKRWRKFMPLSHERARDVLTLGIDADMPVDRLMAMLQQRHVIEVTSRFIERLGAWMDACGKHIAEPEALLRSKVAPPPSPRQQQQQQQQQQTAGHRGQQQAQNHQNQKERPVFRDLRYPPRVLLCAHLIVGHPDVVLNGGQSEAEESLREHAKKMLDMWKLALQSFRDGAETSRRVTMAIFHDAWQPYLAKFVEWKSGDAAALEHDLTLMACRLEGSMLSLCGRDALEGRELTLPDHEAIRIQTIQDVQSLRDHVMKVAGEAGAKRLDDAIAEVREDIQQVWTLRDEQGNQSTDDTAEDDTHDAHFAAGAPSNPQSPQSVQAAMSRASSEQTTQQNSSSSMSSTLLKAKIMHELLHDPSWQIVESPPPSPGSPASASVTSDKDDHDDDDGGDTEGTNDDDFSGGGAENTTAVPVDLDPRMVLSRSKFRSVRAALHQTPSDPRPLCALLQLAAVELSENLPEKSHARAALQAEVNACFCQSSTIEEFVTEIDNKDAWESGRLAALLCGELGTALVDRLQRAATLIRSLSAPIRDAAALADFQSVSDELSNTMERVAAERSYSEVLRNDAIDAVLKAVKFLVDNICQLKRDVANALLRQLSVFYQHEDGPAYVHHALAREYGLEKPKKRARDAEDAERREEEEQDADNDDAEKVDIESLLRALPRTYPWIADAVAYSDGLIAKWKIPIGNIDDGAAAPAVEGGEYAEIASKDSGEHEVGTEEDVSDALSSSTSSARSSASSSPEERYKIPSRLCTGFTMPVSSRSSSTDENEDDASAFAECAVIPVVPEYSHLVVRLGVMKTVIASSAAVKETNLPECLQFDLARLFESQELFQRLLVKACAILVLKQRPLKAPPLTGDAMSAALHRLDVMLKSDIDLDQLGALVAALAAPPGSFPSAEDDALVKGLLRRALDSDAPTFTIVFNAIETAMQYILRLGVNVGSVDMDGQQSAGEKAARAELKKLGAADFIYEDVLHITTRMAKIADISMAEHSSWWFDAYAFVRATARMGERGA